MTYVLYTSALIVLLAAYAPRAVYRRLVHGVPFRLRERFGYVAGRSGGVRAGWIHAVSVGEAIAAGPLVEGLRRAYPNLPLVITTVTDTGAQVVQERFAALASHRFFPIDLPSAARRAVEAINPAFLLCMETELWPNVLRVTARRGVPVMIVNGRISDRSFRRYRLARCLLRPLLESVRVFAMQSDEDARRIIALGATPERVVVTGNLKHETPTETDGGVEIWQRLLGLGAAEQVWIAGSTHHGEEALILDAHALVCRHRPNVVLVIAPRHPERVTEVAGLIAARGLTPLRRSELPRQRVRDAVIVLDTVGELAQLYAIADVVFVGGSLVPSGGHNMLEPAFRRRPVLFGPHTANFRDAAALILNADAGRVVKRADDLAVEVGRLLDDPRLRARMGSAGYEAVAARHGALPRTLELIEGLLAPGASP